MTAFVVSIVVGAKPSNIVTPPPVFRAFPCPLCLRPSSGILATGSAADRASAAGSATGKEYASENTRTDRHPPGIRCAVRPGRNACFLRVHPGARRPRAAPRLGPDFPAEAGQFQPEVSLFGFRV